MRWKAEASLRCVCMLRDTVASGTVTSATKRLIFSDASRAPHVIALLGRKDSFCKPIWSHGPWRRVPLCLKGDALRHVIYHVMLVDGDNHHLLIHFHLNYTLYDDISWDLNYLLHHLVNDHFNTAFHNLVYEYLLKPLHGACKRDLHTLYNSCLNRHLNPLLHNLFNGSDFLSLYDLDHGHLNNLFDDLHHFFFHISVNRDLHNRLNYSLNWNFHRNRHQPLHHTLDWNLHMLEHQRLLLSRHHGLGGYLQHPLHCDSHCLLLLHGLLTVDEIFYSDIDLNIWLHIKL
mmetsp:Transcript_56965/g.94513  ORF Transcript_56965/g.94513 Transcript_56965/m.94513 type:complete len:288 (+) Transcript_56965:523-1386(+)